MWDLWFFLKNFVFLWGELLERVDRYCLPPHIFGSYIIKVRLVVSEEFKITLIFDFCFFFIKRRILNFRFKLYHAQSKKYRMQFWGLFYFEYFQGSVIRVSHPTRIRMPVLLRVKEEIEYALLLYATHISASKLCSFSSGSKIC